MKANVHVIRAPVIVACALAACLASGVSCRPESPAKSRPERPFDPLEYAWRFARVVPEDAADRAAAQEEAALAMVARGEPDRALKQAEDIGNWRRGVVLAAVAGRMGEDGRTREGQRVLAQARELAAGITDWPRDRLRLHIGEAAALLGEEGVVTDVGNAYAGSQDHQSRATFARAAALAARGAWDEAEALLDAQAEGASYDNAVWRARGYARLARLGAVDTARAAALLDKAWEAAGLVPGYQRRELQMEVADALADAGLAEAAAARMNEVTDGLLNTLLPGHIKVPLLGEAAIRWARIGNAEEVARLADIALPLIGSEKEMQNIERPAALARFGAACALAGNRARAVALYGRAVAEAEALVNGRPRALAAVAICLALERGGADDASLRDGLRRLAATFAEGA